MAESDLLIQWPGRDDEEIGLDLYVAVIGLIWKWPPCPLETMITRNEWQILIGSLKKKSKKSKKLKGRIEMTSGHPK